MIQSFSTLPDSAQLWIYTASDPLQSGGEALVQNVKQFIFGWTSHGSAVKGDAFLLENQFLVLGAYVEEGDLSGCGIDDSVREINRLARLLDIHWADAVMVAFRDALGRVQIVSRPHFRALSRAQEVSADTIVFDTGLSSVGDWRAGRFERPAMASWHADVFGLVQAA